MYLLEAGNQRGKVSNRPLLTVNVKKEPRHAWSFLPHTMLHIVGIISHQPERYPVLTGTISNPNQYEFQPHPA